MIVCLTPPQMNDFCDLLGTPYAPVSKIAPVKSEMIFGKIIQLCSSSNNVVQHPKQLPIVLMPSSYDLAAKNHPDEEGCVNIILVCGSLVLLGTISAIVALIFGLI